MRGERHDKAPEIPNLVRKKPCKRRPHHIRHRNDAVDESHLQGDREKGSGLTPGPHLLNRQAEGPHVDDQVGVEHHQAPALEEKYELDPEQVCFTEIIPEPAEVRSVPSCVASYEYHLLSLVHFLVKVSGRMFQQDNSGLHWNGPDEGLGMSVFPLVSSPLKSSSSVCKASPSSASLVST